MVRMSLALIETDDEACRTRIAEICRYCEVPDPNEAARFAELMERIDTAAERMAAESVQERRARR